jgi:multiple antibiotic resistance protein
MASDPIRILIVDDDEGVLSATCLPPPPPIRPSRESGPEVPRSDGPVTAVSADAPARGTLTTKAIPRGSVGRGPWIIQRADSPQLKASLNTAFVILFGHMQAVSLLVRYFVLAFSVLLPLINPLGSALVILALVGNAPLSVYRTLARKAAINTTLFLLVFELVGAALLAFFGISLPVVQVAGGLVIAGMGWSLLNQQDSDTSSRAESQIDGASFGAIEEKSFYPITFPITAGPGCIVVTLTVSAHASRPGLVDNVIAHLGILLAIVVLSGIVFFCYASAPRITALINPRTAHGILRVIAFVLLCIGVQITWNGVDSLLKSVLTH